jgi:hypothetical protein
MKQALAITVTCFLFLSACQPQPLPPPEPSDHCDNGIQDEGEVGVDCGGPDCEPCQNDTQPDPETNPPNGPDEIQPPSLPD